ncbi:MAG: 16S rRNA (guanine(966)-N(2))-methyltransferase RsmD [Rhodospirillales bacterium]|nr:16S rRNA (guanine(966)-N(2))-methyltransferase RsmD [Rhodospirillales bacterium]
MRIVGGTFKGRRLQAPDGRDLRPTADRAREAVFNILGHGLGVDLNGLVVVDFFAGTGAMGLEALSRGAIHATFVDQSSEANRFTRKNTGALGAAQSSTILKLDASDLPPPPLVAKAPCALAFFDPPYGSGLAAPALMSAARKGWIEAGSVCTVEFAAKENFDVPPGFDVLDERKYGAARFFFLEMA